MDETDTRLDRRARRDDPAAWSARSSHGVVACAHYRAADAGAEILAAGGNAADAAVAAALALNVCEPAASGLGGMAMIVGHGLGDGTPFCLDGACTAPAAATPERVRAAHRYRGYRAVAVPGAPAAWSALHRRYGKLPLAEVARPAATLARQGHAVTPMQHELAQSYRKAIQSGNAAALVDDERGAPHPIGAVLTNSALADTIERLGAGGLMGFYRDEIASCIDGDMRANGGFVTASDLATVEEPEPLAPIAVDFGVRRLFTAGPPAGGLALAQLVMMANVIGRPLDLQQPEDLTLVAEMIRRVRRDRRRHRLTMGARELGMAGELLSKRLAQSAMSDVHRAWHEGAGETSHLCAMDAAGGSVSMTMSIERSFGSACLNARLGFLYNGYLRGFKIENRRHPHYLRPGAPARSNAAPTIVAGPDDETIAIGSTGSERMISGIFTTLLRLHRESPFEAVAAPRVHCTPEGVVLAEWDRLPAPCQNELERRYRVTRLSPFAFQVGGLQLAVRKGATMTGVGEPRRDGGASVPRYSGLAR